MRVYVSRIPDCHLPLTDSSLRKQRAKLIVTFFIVRSSHGLYALPDCVAGVCSTLTQEGVAKRFCDL